METTEIIENIQKGLKLYSEKHSIPANDIGIRISKKISNGMLGKSESLVLTLMNTDKEVESDISLAKLFNINMAVEMIVKPQILSKLNKISNSEQKVINKDLATATIFTKDLSFEPSIRLNEQIKFIRELTIEELTN